jgi:hypothetical protein
MKEMSRSFMREINYLRQIIRVIIIILIVISISSSSHPVPAVGKFRNAT